MYSVNYTKVQYLEKVGLYYSQNNTLPTTKVWHEIKNIDMTSWDEILESFGGRKKLRTRVKFHLSKRVWTLDKLKEGFESYYKKYGKYPTAPEVDDFPDLPTFRNIQRYYGGLRNLRKLMGLEVHDYTIGGYRKKWASIYNKQARLTEVEVREFLDKRYGEICVHEERKYGDGKNAMDFFVYCKKNFGVDVFKTSSYKNLAKNINIKQKKYKNFPFRLFFVVVGNNHKQKKIDILMKNKENPLPKNTSCLTFDAFRKECQKFIPLTLSLNYTKIRN